MAEREPAHQRGGEARTARYWTRAGLGIVAAITILAAVGVLIVQQAGDRGSGPGQAPYVPNGPMPAITVAGDQILRGGQPWWFLGFNSFTWSDNCNDPSE